jgi:hypothetical protein
MLLHFVYKDMFTLLKSVYKLNVLGSNADSCIVSDGAFQKVKSSKIFK